MAGPTEPSTRQQQRNAYRRRRTLRRVAAGTISSIVVLTLAAWFITQAPGWPRVREVYFSADHARESFPAILDAFWLNVRLFLTVEVLVLPLALLVAVIRVVPSAAMAPFKFLAAAYTDIFRGIPTILVVMLVGFGFPALGMAGVPTSLFWLGVISLTLSYGAYVAEVLRAGILSIHPTQWAAGRALGLGYGQTLVRVILPQAVRNVTPPLMNDFVSLQKDTALVSVIGLVEALRAAQVYQATTFNVTSMCVAAVFFIVVTIPLARFTDWLTIRSMRRQGGR
ncbi:ABC transporter permease subunit [Aeromicrobium sp. 636]|uniref:Amino acid ABC transporter permease n=1 Tax=Aeromicrobium senzhongii TaxID=2663859 RepID=A0A8I0EWX9_9ACTN|nr:amino acid ABC transporter permease [Aeromicrobium senzhongii]MCQ3998956.1 ABC transporter permease subunit [Aeromicrobium sp. 636]MTB89538.1 ABC transporter permease subunit [Aeromicrobium senzhongii]QNL96040.1 amino acid ABC transporter permease [Aeromicrobium senzhongii]